MDDRRETKAVGSGEWEQERRFSKIPGSGSVDFQKFPGAGAFFI
jgi:hypothetical protein